MKNTSLNKRVSARLLFLCFVGVLGISFAGHAETYMYTDDQGTLHFVDEPGSIPKKYRKNARTMDDLPALNITEAPKSTYRPRPSEPERPRKEEARAGGQVEVFVTSWCGYCKKTLRYLNEKGIAYTAYDIEKDPQAGRRFQELGGGGVPLVLIGANRIRGFNPRAIDRYAGK